jgi:glucose/arabinose dehydrogenase
MIMQLPFAKFAPVLALVVACFGAGTVPVVAQAISVTAMATGLDEPWGVDFLPDGGFLVTERVGKLWLYQDGERKQVSGVPRVADNGQGGLLDVMVTRDFAQSRRVWLTYARQVEGGLGTEAGFGRLSGDGSRIEGFRAVISPLGRRGGRHFGARLVEAADGTVFVTTGDRGAGPLAQEVSGPEGKVLAFNRDGAPLSHPAFGAQGWPGLHSLGHRNIQGAALDAQGRLWTVEHGAKGGDEVNLVAGGQNFGWPVITYGRDYNGTKIGEGTTKDGMEQPSHYWDPSIAPSGMVIHSGKMFADWKGHFLVGSLKFDYIARLDPKADFAEVRIETPQTGRVRDVMEAPDGSVWFLSVIDGAVYRISR